MKLKNILTESATAQQLIQVGNTLKEKGWVAKILSSFYPTISVTSPDGKKLKLLDNDAEIILDLIPGDVYGKENRKSWVLGYLSSEDKLKGVK